MSDNSLVIFRCVLRGIRVALRNDPYSYEKEAAEMAARKLQAMRFRYPVEKNSFYIFKKSVDARKPGTISFVYSVGFLLKEPVVLNREQAEAFQRFCAAHGVSVLREDDFAIPSRRTARRPVVAGFGPGGMFCALILARAGLCPIVLERGSDADRRSEQVKRYWEEGILDTESNVQFGEGGAGTFSDGKLLTRINDPLCSYVLKTFYEHGADRDILVNAKPHVGTDKLRQIVKNIRKTIVSLGGEVRFNVRLTGVGFGSDGRVKYVSSTAGELETDALFLAVGHSARDTFADLFRQEVVLCAKPFSVGVRVEHLQKNIDRALYGAQYENPALPKGEYALSRRFGDRAVYSFCMCPGGTVVASASEEGTIVTNGMSVSARDGVNANAAVAVSVNEKDFGGDVFSAIRFQRDIEEKAFAVARGAAPVETMGHFLGTGGLGLSEVCPTYTGKTALCDLAPLFPPFVADLLKKGFLSFEGQLQGFCSPSAVLTAPETRTSSPVRMPRDTDTLQAQGHWGLYPCGEGAGYAGGITSAAVDGIRCALAYLKPKDSGTGGKE